MRTLKKFIEGDIGLPLSMFLPKNMQLFPIDDALPEKAYLFGSEQAKKRLYLLQGDIYRFLHQCPEFYYLVGYFGYGANSHAFFWSYIDSSSKVFFRLPICGGYMDNELQAKLIRKFIKAFVAFEEMIKNKTKHFIALDSMGYGFYRILLKNGQCFELEESLLHNPDFNLILEKGESPDGKYKL